MNPIRHAMRVVKGQVQNVEARYERYHPDLVSKLVEVISKQEEGLSAKKRRAEVVAIITAFGNSVAAQEED